ncbi:MAG: hypothetical protein R3342_08875 [Lutibacter sp.]|uniref:type IX secretion system periplasmic lipoprotein PorW/SprE n=1 Tax=Lutibacter sp. TaxID=1925666 RepID=UPI00299EC927|nr:hypothetical protein [Lutibacter sp.]MDX1829645.1 hypothetical protein [Lutibacter sp.]
MKISFKIPVSLLIILVVVSCSTKKDAFLNRTYHSVATKYNVLYNGKVALQKGLTELNQNYKDDYWKILPIEPLKVDELALPGIQQDADTSPKEFDKAEEKAVKAVQKHSMLIARRERNNQIDDAYLLLGKARYYSKRFVPALEAFNFVLLNYPNANLINETKIWQAKTLVRLQNPEQAIDNLKMLFKYKDLKDNIKEEAHTAIAMAYVATDSLKQEIFHLNKAVEIAENKEQTARNLFVLGQLYQQKKEIDSSNIAFQKLLDLKKAPYKYKIHAAIEKAKNARTNEEKTVAIANLKKRIKDRDNRPYLDALYYQLGDLQLASNDSIATSSFKNSLANSKTPNFQKELAYQALGTIYFNKANYVTAGAYYDSILAITKNTNTKRIRSIKRKRNNLNEVLSYESITKNTDSILNVVAMSKQEQADYYTNYIDELKKAEEQQQQKLNTGNALFASGGDSNNNGNNNSGKWYFYNPQTVGFGSQEFKKIWGNRPLEDNWRLSDKTQINLNNTKASNTKDQNVVKSSEKYDLNFYLNQIPSSKKQIDSIKVVRNDAYYKLGLIYKEQFHEYNLAVNKLEKLLTFNPSKDLELPAKFHLYKIYEKLKNSKADTYKNNIVTNFPDSKYAKLIINPKLVLKENDENSPEKIYEKLYYQYKDEDYEAVIKKADSSISLYEGKAIVPKFELLKAYAIGKKDGLQAFKEALNFVAMNYPNTNEGKKALAMVKKLKAKL